MQMERSKFLDRQQQSKNTLRQYSVELGLRTHRPSALTPDLYLAKNSTRSTISNASMLPQYGDTSNWWKVPRYTNVNYEQKTKAVQISYSAKEIYGKAQLEQPVKEDAKLHQSENIRATSQSNDDLKLCYKLCNMEPAQPVRQSSAAYDFLHFTNHESRYSPQLTSRISAWEENPPTESATKEPIITDFNALKLKTFEEAIEVYPSSDSEMSDIDIIGDKQRSLEQSNSDGCYQYSKHEANTDNPTTASVIGSSSHTSNGFSCTETQNLMHEPEDESQNRAVNGLYSVKDSETSFIKTDNGAKPDQDSQQEQELCQGLQIPLEESFTQKRSISCDTSDTDDENNKNKGECKQHSKVFGNHPVPKIDLTQLSPKRTKSPRLKKPSTVSKSTNFTTTKARRDLPNNNAKSAHFTNNTRQIVEQIRRKVSNNPKEIIKEIKKRVQGKIPQSDPSTQSMESKWKNFHLNTENTVEVVSGNRPDRQYCSVYDKYYAMSPRIETGEVSIWSCLPDELWLHILSYLDRSSLYALMVTSHEFNRLTHDRSLWKKLFINKRQLSDDEILKVGQLRPARLSITQCTGTKLNGDTVSNYGLMTMFSACGKNLKTLSIASCVIPPLSGEALLHSAAIHCERITALDISWCNITNKDVILIGDSFPGLMSLCMNGNQSITDLAVMRICEKFAYQLCTLELQGCFKITNDSLETISLCTSLSSLSLGHCHKLNSSALATCIRQLQDLKYLNLKGLKQIRDSCVAAIVKYCTKIERFNISQCTGLTPRTLTEISCALSNLTALDMALCKNSVNDMSLSCLLANCKSIESLDLSSNPITNISLSNLATNCLSLRDLKINFCSVTDSGVRQLLGSLEEKIRTVQLYGVKGINAHDLSLAFPMVNILS